jgi:hypothetical protein
MLNGDLESVAQPHGLRAPDVHLNDHEHLDPQNVFLPSQKLLYSLEMAEAISLLRKSVQCRFRGALLKHPQSALLDGIKQTHSPFFLMSTDSYPGGVIVHDDIQMSQFLFTQDMHLKLNDFNRAEVMTFNEDENEYCRYTNNPGRGKCTCI